MINRIKVLAALIMAVFVALFTQQLYYKKTTTIRELYSDIIFTRLAVEAQQYTSQIEYGIKNGKSLENFYNIQVILNGVSRCYSYISSAYIVSDNYTILYSLQNDSDDIIDLSVMRGYYSFQSDEIYAVYNDTKNDRYIMTVPIYGKNDICGYMVLDIVNSSINNLLNDYTSQSLIQSIIISAEIYAFGLIALIHFCKKKDKLMKSIFTVITSTISLSIIIDGAISVSQLMININSIIQQSVTKITMTLQNDLDTIIDRGVPLIKIHDLNSWLFESCKDIPFIDNLIYDKSYKISAVISGEYVWQRVISYALVFLAALAICVCISLLIYFTVIIIRKHLIKGAQKNVDNNPVQSN